MEGIVVLVVIGLVCWAIYGAYEAGRKNAEQEQKRKETEQNTPDWGTFRGSITSFSGTVMPGLYALHVQDKPDAYCSVVLKDALSENFDGGTGVGRVVIYTIDDGNILQGFTKLEEWTGPVVPDEGIYEKTMTKLQPLHKNQFLTDFLREQVQNNPSYKGVKFY